jgi:hypothetical protein
VAVRARWWAILRPPLAGAAAAVLLALAGGLAAGHAGVWRNTIQERGAQDFGIFFTSVRHAVAGRSLYTPTRLRGRTTRRFVTGPPNLNLPHSLVLLLPLARLPPRAALAVWLAASLVAAAWCAWATLRALRWRPPWLAGLAVVVYLMAWAPSAAFSLTAQVSFLLAWPVCAGWLAHRAGRSGRAGVWIGLAMAMKPFLGLFVPYFLLRRDGRALAGAAAAIAAMGLLGAAVFGPGAYVEWLRQLPHVSWAGHYMNASWFSLVERALGDTEFQAFGHAPLPAWAISVAGAAVVAVVTFARIRPPAHAAPAIDREWACVLLAALLLSPLGWTYYVWIALWPLAALVVQRAPWRAPAWRDVWLLPGVAGWLWWGRMTAWGQPHPLATLTLASMYFWALLALWVWALGARPRAG